MSADSMVGLRVFHSLGVASHALCGHPALEDRVGPRALGRCWVLQRGDEAYGGANDHAGDTQGYPKRRRSRDSSIRRGVGSTRRLGVTLQDVGLKALGQGVGWCSSS